MLADVCSNASSIKSMTVTQEKKYYKFKPISQPTPNPELSFWERLLGSSEFFLDNRAWQSKTTKPMQGCTG